MYELTYSSFQSTDSLPEFRGRTMATFHVTQVILVIGAMVIGGLAVLRGAPRPR